MRLAITGHRPKKLGGNDCYNPECKQRKAIRKAIRDYFTIHKPDYIITGGALGVDQDAARVAHNMGIPFSVIAPCVNHSSNWPTASKISYDKMCAAADKHIILDVPYSSHAMQERNKYMVDMCDRVLAVWDGSNSGTGHCVAYAIACGKHVDVINPDSVYLDALIGRVVTTLIEG